MGADAGNSPRLIAPASTAVLSGAALNAQNPVYQWTQLSGPNNAIIAQPNQPKTTVSNLVPGLYTFNLNVVDSTGKSANNLTAVSVLVKMTWNIENVQREALVHPPAIPNAAAPVIFAFHGHGGTDLGFAERNFEKSWPEAIVVYPQGLPTKSPSDPNCQNSGWQHAVGEVSCTANVKDSDLKFFDAMLSTLQTKYNTDLNRVFVHGWSNGGGFVYNVLWSERGEKLAAIAPAAAIVQTTNGKIPMPMIHIAGTSDSKVPFKNQLQGAQKVEALDSCSAEGSVWATGPSKILGTSYSSTTGKPVVFLQYDGDHAYPFTVPPYIVDFFKQIGALRTVVRPSITFFPPEEKVQSGTILLKARVTDNSPIVQVSFYVMRKSGRMKLLGTSMRPDQDGNYAIDFDTATLGDTTHEFYAVVYDTAGNTKTSDLVYIHTRN